MGFTKDGTPLYSWEQAVLIQTPTEVDFIKQFYPKDPEGARQYFKLLII